MSCKDIIRREMIEKRKMLDLKNGEDFVKNIRNTSCYKNAKTVMLYMPIKGEADVTGLLSDDKVFLTPVTEGEDMSACLVGDVTEGAFGVMEPIEKEAFDKDKIDLVIVPGVAFDKAFNRMGFGKGYYDRFLKDMRAIKIGVCHLFQIVDHIPCEKHDVKMDMIVTERDVWTRESI
ncbi:MAG: 5-formyltetrahydrofolate cyclo-ligase [Clostridia bacterium]|nr:5-formyltetrahydrofolate cyclo-ligase [Clostridia bacterium]